MSLRQWLASALLLATVDAATGAIRQVSERAAETAGDTFLAWQFPLHSGRAFGLTGRILICMTGLVVAILSVTGVVIWLRKRCRSYRRVASRSTPTIKPETQEA